MAARILHAEKVWSHDAFFDYVERWMEEHGTEAIQAIRKATGHDYSASWARQGQAWNPFVNQMWSEYHHNLPRASSRETPGASEGLKKPCRAE